MLGRLAAVASAEATAGTSHREDVDVVDDPVYHRGGDGLVSERCSPAGEWQVESQDAVTR